MLAESYIHNGAMKKYLITDLINFSYLLGSINLFKMNIELNSSSPSINFQNYIRGDD